MISTVLPGRTFGLTRRISRLIFSLDAADLSVTPRTGQVPTLARAGAGTAIDATGRVRQLVHSQPRFHWTDFDGDGVRETVVLHQEGVARANLVAQPNALTTANGWAWNGSATVTPAYSTLGRLDLSRVMNADTGPITRAVTFTGDGVKAFSCVVQFDGVSGTTQHGFRDADAGVFPALITVTWAADGTATAAPANGALLSFSPYAEHAYRINANSAPVTASHAHNVYASNPGTATSVRVGAVQCEDGTAPSTIIPVSPRPAESLSFPLNALPQAMTIYHDAMWYVAPDASTNWNAWAIGAGQPYLVGRLDGTTLCAASLHHNGTSLAIATTANAALYGHRGELRTVVQGDGAVITGLAIDGGPEQTAAASAANPFAGAWGSAVLYLGGQNGAQPGMFGVRAMKIAAGVRSMAFMRAAG